MGNKGVLSQITKTGWEKTTLGKVLIESKEKFDPHKSVNEKYIGLEHIEKDTGFITDYGNSSETLSTKNKFNQGDLLYGKLRPYLNKVTVPEFEGVCSTDILVFKKYDYLSNHFIKYRLLSRDFVNYAQLNVSGVQHPRINIKFIDNFPIDLPPLPEQHRIVDKIEELFSELDNGVENLKKAQAQLKTYRQAVLKYAFEGKLTEAWRRQNSPEPAEKLLEQIKAEREKQYQQQLKEWETACAQARKDGAKKPAKPQKPKDLSPLTDTELRELPELPEGWCWDKVGTLSMSMKNGIYKSEEFYAKNGTPCLRMYNIENGKIAWFDIKRMILSQDEIDEYELKSGDLLVNRVNSRELVGKTAIIKSLNEKSVYESKNIRLRIIDKINSAYINFWFLLYANGYFNKNAQQTVGMASINLTS